MVFSGGKGKKLIIGIILLAVIIAGFAVLDSGRSGMILDLENHTAVQPTSATTTVKETMITSPITSPEPIFTKTGPTIDADGTPVLSKSQAWNYAEKYLESYGLTNILPEEVKASEPKLFTDEENNQTLIWTFEIDRNDSMGFERGGIIAIDAYNGDVGWYAEFT